MPSDYRRRSRLISHIRTVYESFGYLPIDTPVLERLEYLSGKAGEEAEQLMFRVLKRGAKLSLDRPDELADMGLRYDLTVSLCRFYASNHQHLPRIFRRYHVAPVWRADRPQHGRLREFFQCDVDMIGESSNFAECEVIVATLEALARLGLTRQVVRVSDRRLLPTIFSSIGIDSTKIPRLMTSIDKLDKIGVEGVLTEADRYLVGDEKRVVADLVDVVSSTAGGPFAASTLGDFGRHPGLSPILENLRQISANVAEATAGGAQLLFWPALVRGMGYYTGPIYEIWDAERPFSLAGGGRYDGLIGNLLGRDVPACGFSIGFERILTLLEARDGEQAAVTSTADVMLAIRDENAAGAAMRLANQLHMSSVSVEVHPYTTKITRQFEHAERLGIPWIVVLHGTGQPTFGCELIDRQSRVRRTVESATLADLLRELVGSRRPTVLTG